MRHTKGEVWKHVAGYEDLYLVSNLGNVRSLDRVDSLGRLRYGRTLAPGVQANGYLFVTLHNKGVAKTARIHRLVAQAFIENPDNLSDVNHIDEDKTNNRADNLEWCSHKHNLNHSDVCKKSAKKTARPVVATDVNGVEHFYESQMEAERATGIYHNNIAKCCKGKVRTAGGFLWRYA